MATIQEENTISSMAELSQQSQATTYVSNVEVPYAGYIDAIVYIFYEESSFTRELLVHTRNANPKIPIVLIGNSNMQPYVQTFNTEFIDMSSLSVDLSYNYVHFSPNDYDYEKRRFDRWLVLDEYMKTSPYNKILYSDYDNALFAEANEIIPPSSTPGVVYVGNDNVCVPNILFMERAVSHAIGEYIRSFYGRDVESIRETIGSMGMTEGNVHYSDVWLLRDAIACVEGSGGEYYKGTGVRGKVVRATAEGMLIDAEYYSARARVYMGMDGVWVDGVRVYNMYFNGDSKLYPYGEN